MVPKFNPTSLIISYNGHSVKDDLKKLKGEGINARIPGCIMTLSGIKYYYNI